MRATSRRTRQCRSGSERHIAAASPSGSGRCPRPPKHASGRPSGRRSGRCRRSASNSTSRTPRRWVRAARELEGAGYELLRPPRRSRGSHGGPAAVTGMRIPAGDGTVGASGGYRSPLLRGGTPRWKLDVVAGERCRPARSSNWVDSMTPSCGRWLTRPSSTAALSRPPPTPRREPRGLPGASARLPAGRSCSTRRRRSAGAGAPVARGTRSAPRHGRLCHAGAGRVQSAREQERA
jgi:hypothetical protein